MPLHMDYKEKEAVTKARETLHGIVFGNHRVLCPCKICEAYDALYDALYADESAQPKILHIPDTDR